MGFREAASNLPVHHDDSTVTQAAPAVQTPQAEVSAVDPVATAYTGGVITPQVQYAYLPYAQNYGYAAGENGYYGAAAPRSTTYYGAAASGPVVQVPAAEVVQAAPATASQCDKYQSIPGFYYYTVRGLDR